MPKLHISPQWGQFWARALVVLAIAAAVEFAAGVFEPFWDRLLPYRQDKDALYRDMLGSSRTYDRVIVGSSTALMGIDPALIDAAVGGTTFNAGQLGYSPASLALDVVREVSDARKARAIVYAVDSWVTGAQFPDRKEVDAHGRSAHALWLFRTFRNRDVFLFWISHLIRGDYMPARLAWVQHLQAGGRFLSFDGAKLRDNGYLETFGALNPDWAGFLRPSAMGQMQGAKLGELFGFLRMRKLPLVVVRLPEFASTYQKVPDGHRHLSEFLQTEAAKFGFSVLDYTDAGAFAHGDTRLFFDVHHLNAAGAAVFSEILGRDLAALRVGQP